MCRLCDFNMSVDLTGQEKQGGIFVQARRVSCDSNVTLIVFMLDSGIFPEVRIMFSCEWVVDWFVALS